MISCSDIVGLNFSLIISILLHNCNDLHSIFGEKPKVYYPLSVLQHFGEFQINVWCERKSFSIFNFFTG